jgi:hypothetical protein
MKQKACPKKAENNTLGDLIAAVNTFARNERETVAAVVDLLQSGRVCFAMNGTPRRARVHLRY